MSITFDSVLGHKISIAILHLLWKQQEGKTGRQMARELNLSPQAVHNAIGPLEEQGLITSQTVGRAKNYRLNQQHFLLTAGLIPLWENMADWQRKLGSLYTKHLKTPPLSIILYGSFVHGKEKKGSDFDLLLLFKKEPSQEQIDKILELDEQVFRTFGFHPSCKALTVEKFIKGAKEKEGFLRNVLKEGKAIDGEEISELIFYGRKKN